MPSNVMSRKQAFEFVAQIGASVFASMQRPSWPEGVEYAEADDVADALHAFTRNLVGAFDQLPEELSDDLEVQEMIREGLDRIFSDLVVQMEAAIQSMRSRSAC